MILKKLLFILTFLFIPSITLAVELTGNLNLFSGYKYMDESDWGPVEDQTEFGISLDSKIPNWPVSIVWEILYSDEKARVSDRVIPVIETFRTYVHVDIDEYALGIRKNISLQHNSNVFFGGGVTIIKVRVGYENPSLPGGPGGDSSSSVVGQVGEPNLNELPGDDDSAFGFWVSAGLYVTLAEHYNIGIQTRWSKADVTLFDEDADAGGLHGLLFVGYHW